MGSADILEEDSPPPDSPIEKGTKETVLMYKNSYKSKASYNFVSRRSGGEESGLAREVHVITQEHGQKSNTESRLKLILVAVWLLLSLPGFAFTGLTYLRLTKNEECRADDSENSAGNMSSTALPELSMSENCFGSYNESLYLNTCSLYIGGYSLTGVCILGVMANILTCLVLAQYRVLSIFSKLLAVLAVVDGVLLLVFLVDSGLPNLVGQPAWYDHLVPTMHPVKHMTITGSIYAVLIIAVERERAILHPLKISPSFSICCTFLLIFSVSVNLPKFLEFQVLDINGTSVLLTTDLAEDKTYMKWCNYWDQLIIHGAIPFAVLAVANFRICKSLTKSESKRMDLTGALEPLELKSLAGDTSLPSTNSCWSRVNSSRLNRAQAEEKRESLGRHNSTWSRCSLQRKRSSKDVGIDLSIADKPSSIPESPVNMRRQQQSVLKRRRAKSIVVLTAIVVLFLVCQSFRLLFKIIEISLIEDHVSIEVFRFCNQLGRHSVPPYLMCISHLNHILLVCNSALNFFLYCWVGRKFRMELRSYLSKCFLGRLLQPCFCH